jgi:hypothetical protein
LSSLLEEKIFFEKRGDERTKQRKSRSPSRERRRSRERQRRSRSRDRKDVRRSRTPPRPKRSRTPPRPRRDRSTDRPTRTISQERMKRPDIRRNRSQEKKDDCVFWMEGICRYERENQCKKGVHDVTKKGIRSRRQMSGRHQETGPHQSHPYFVQPVADTFMSQGSAGRVTEAPNQFLSRQPMMQMVMVPAGHQVMQAGQGQVMQAGQGQVPGYRVPGHQ